MELDRLRWDRSVRKEKGEKAKSVNRNKIGSVDIVSICNEISSNEGEVFVKIKEILGLDHEKPAALETKARAFAERGKVLG
jgi:hypothetical protein